MNPSTSPVIAVAQGPGGMKTNNVTLGTKWCEHAWYLTTLTRSAVPVYGSHEEE